MSGFRWFRKNLQFPNRADRVYFAFRLVAGIVFIHEHGWTDFVLVACFADNPNQVRARHLQLMRFTQLVKLFKVGTYHVKIPYEEFPKPEDDMAIMRVYFRPQRSMCYAIIRRRNRW